MCVLCHIVRTSMLTLSKINRMAHWGIVDTGLQVTKVLRDRTAELVGCVPILICLVVHILIRLQFFR